MMIWIYRLLSVLPLLSFTFSPATAQELYGLGVNFPKPTPAQLDSLLRLGLIPSWLDTDPTLYWPRSAITIAGRLTQRTFMSQAIEGGFGAEGNLALPLAMTDYGFFLYARANNYTVLNRVWLDWDVANGGEGVLYNGGVGASIAIPLYASGFAMPFSMSIGSAFFQPKGTAAPAETYIGLEPSLGVRYRVMPTVSLSGMIQASYMVPLREGNRALGSWNFSLGVELALAPYQHKPLQHWVPALVVTAQDVIRLMGKEPNSQLNVLDRNMDFINTELKPLTGFGWRPLGFRGIVRGKVIGSSRAASGNVTALDIELAPDDSRGFRVWRTAILLDSTRALRYLVGNTDDNTASAQKRDKEVLERIKRGDYAYRSPGDMGVRYLRAELFPESKGDLNLVPRVGSRVQIAGDLWWDGDGHMEIHPRRPADVTVISGEILDSDDESILE